MPSAANLTLQIGSLYASGPTSTFTGTGGPWGYSIWTSQFGGVVSSAGLASQPFADTVYNVAAGDEVIFVLAVQNLGGSSASSVTLKATMPTGFAELGSGLNLTVIDGTGTDLATTGDLFSNGGLQVGVPLAAYDANSGLNVTLVTYSLVATQALPGPNTDIPVSPAITSYVDGGGNAVSLPPAVHTDVVSAEPIPVVTPETDPTAVAKGSTIAFDVSLTLPAGSLPNLVVAPVLPSGTAMLDLVSASVVSLGSGLTLGTPTVNGDGSVHFGTVQASGTATSAQDTLTLRYVLKADGTASGPATFDTTVSATDPNSPGGVWSVSVPSTVGVVLPPPPPTLSGLSSTWSVTTAGADHPFENLVITPASGQATSGTIAITEAVASLGAISTAGPGTINSAGSTFTYSGTLAALQAAARQVQFAGATTGTETLTITVVDSAGGVAQDSTTMVGINPPNPIDPLFDPAYYLAHNPDVAAAGVDPYQHFLTYGWKEGRNPDAFFDVRYYETLNPDVAAAGIDPLLHFEQYGWMEGRQPSLLFSDAAYLHRYIDVAAAGIDPLAHYLQYGQSEGRTAYLVGYDGNTLAADPLVDPNVFFAGLGATLRPTGATGQADAAEQYNQFGWQRGVNPDPWFDTNFYLSQNPDVRAAGMDPLLHYEMYGWREGRDPSLLFSTSGYLAANPSVQSSGVDPLLQFILTGQAAGAAAPLEGGSAAADILVNAAYYDPQLGATLLPSGTGAAQQAAYSYDASGWHKGLNPDAYFDTNYYLSHNPDVAAAHIDPLTHFEQYGWHEGRDPSAQFSVSKYLAAYSDVRAAGLDPLFHFLAYGQAEGRVAFAV